MSCLSWNCHGLGNPQIKDELVELIRNKDPKLVLFIYFMETKVEKVFFWKEWGGRHNLLIFFFFPCHNLGGGLALL